jgi:CheY-like chemotaxis protein
VRCNFSVLDGITPKLIAIAEDNPDEVILLQHAISRAKLPISSFHFCLNGIEMTQFLERTASAGAVPDLALVDLKMPLMDGFEVIRWMRSHSDSEIKEIPIVVMTSSDEPSDNERARMLGCNEYVVKPRNLNELVSIIEGLYCGTIQLDPLIGKRGPVL